MGSQSSGHENRAVAREDLAYCLETLSCCCRWCKATYQVAAYDKNLLIVTLVDGLCTQAPGGAAFSVGGAGRPLLAVSKWRRLSAVPVCACLFLPKLDGGADKGRAIKNAHQFRLRKVVRDIFKSIMVSL